MANKELRDALLHYVPVLTDEALIEKYMPFMTQWFKKLPNLYNEYIHENSVVILTRAHIKGTLYINHLVWDHMLERDPDSVIPTYRLTPEALRLFETLCKL